MAHVHKTLKLTDHVIEEVFAHVYKNSWFNIVDWDNWVIGLADDPEQAAEWHNRNAISAPRFFQSWDCKSVENAKIVEENFRKLGVQDLDENFEGNEATNRFIYAYKSSI